jgi:hypothetical protein
VARASYSRFSGQLDLASIGYMNPSSSAGVAVYRWLDNNSDHFAQADEVQLNQFLGAANGFNLADPTAVTSANRINPDLKAPVTQSFVAGVDREIVELRGRGELHLHAHDGSRSATPRSR